MGEPDSTKRGRGQRIMKSKFGMGREAEGFLTIICREVLDVIDTAEGTPSQVKAEVRSLILSWVNANKLNIEAVKRIDGAYVVSWPRTKEVA